jgi:DNA repair exonuclease SbcCD ATPase subunit
MKRLFICLFVLLLMTASALAQSAARPTPEQSLQELVTEVRQLRATLQRMNAAVYKGQVMLERLKLQQEQVTRISRELRDARDNLSDLRGQQTRIKEVLGRVETEIERGVQREEDKVNLKAELEMLSQREQRMMLRETQLANELEIEQAKLHELNSKLNLLVDQEMSPR